MGFFRETFEDHALLIANPAEKNEPSRLSAKVEFLIRAYRGEDRKAQSLLI